jgi:hypothetical protein
MSLFHISNHVLSLLTAALSEREENDNRNIQDSELNELLEGIAEAMMPQV